jgi:hypothetical protein
MLELLDLQSNQIGDSAAEVLAFSVPDCDTLVELRLDHNEITDIGAMELMNMAQASDSLKVLSFHRTNKLTEPIIEAVGKLGCIGALGAAGESMQEVGFDSDDEESGTKTSEAPSTPRTPASHASTPKSASPMGAGMPRLSLASEEPEPEPEPVADLPQSEADLAARIGVPVEEWEHYDKDDFDELLKTKTDMDLEARVESKKIYRERSKTSSRDWGSPRPAEAPVLLNVKLLEKACQEGGTPELQAGLQGVLNHWKADRWALKKELGHGSGGVVYSSSDSHQP